MSDKPTKAERLIAERDRLIAERNRLVEKVDLCGNEFMGESCALAASHTDHRSASGQTWRLAGTFYLGHSAEELNLAAERDRLRERVSKLERERDNARYDASESQRERDSHRRALNKIANWLGVVHEDPKIDAAVRKLGAERDRLRKQLAVAESGLRDINTCGCKECEWAAGVAEVHLNALAQLRAEPGGEGG